MSKVSQMSVQSFSQKPANQQEVSLRPQLDGQYALSKEVQVSRKRNKFKVSQKSCHSVSQKPSIQPEVSWRPKLGWSVASSKEVQVSRQPKQFESQPEVESVGQPETSWSAGSALTVTTKCSSAVIERSPSQPKSETSRKSARNRDSQSARN